MFNMRIVLVACIIALSSGFAGGPAVAQVVEGEEHCVVNVKATDALNVRAKGSASSKIVTTLQYGECGIVVTAACKGSWCPIEDGHDAGWVNSRYISMVSPSLYCVTGVGGGDVLNLRAYPSATSTILTKLPRQQCDIAFLPYSTGTWQKVRVNGFEGWASQKYLSGQ
jgi:SH3-like domain-containing protein